MLINHLNGNCGYLGLKEVRKTFFLLITIWSADILEVRINLAYRSHAKEFILSLINTEATWIWRRCTWLHRKPAVEKEMQRK